MAKWESVEVKEGILCMYWEDNVVRNSRWKICIPNSIVKSVLWYMHDSKTAGHVGIKKTFEKSKMSPFYWQNMQDSVKQYVEQCEICGERKNPPKNVIYFNPM